MPYSDRVMFRKRLAQAGIPVTIDQEQAGVRHALAGAQSAVESGTAAVHEVFDGLRDAAVNESKTGTGRLLAGTRQCEAL